MVREKRKSIGSFYSDIDGDRWRWGNKHPHGMEKPSLVIVHSRCRLLREQQGSLLVSRLCSFRSSRTILPIRLAPFLTAFRTFHSALATQV